MGKKAVVAMSGGVDSSVAAALLVEQGYDVTGIMLKLWRGDAVNHDSGCCNLGAAEDARRVADRLEIPFYVLNMAERFEETVIRDFQDSYRSGMTPNPCVRCNQWIKFDALLERADALGAEVLATGHYARVVSTGMGFRLYRGLDHGKDQSYVLWMLRQEELARCSFPVGHIHKSETRAIATQLGLRTAAKPDSQEICFVRGGDTKAYVESELPSASVPGDVVDGSGAVIGTHRGVGHYTVGQRRGLGVSVGVPLFVTSIDPVTNTVAVGDREALRVAGMRIEEARFVASPPASSTPVLVQYRAHGDAYPAAITPIDAGGCEVSFDVPVEAVAPGQSAAFYSAADPDELIGGGIIAATVPALAGV
ncbi:MAG: tRNA 2-thiouridine(34) synthase MnmA [Actinomycetota bacterium]|nr:tRNA 2-thiouridine(34) synthase MnmA [Actinomycetota bacterium]